MVRPGCETFLIPVEHVDELPAGFSDALAAVHPLPTVRGMLLIPPQPFLMSSYDWLRRPWYVRRTTPQRLLAVGDEQITLVERGDETVPEPIVIPVESLLATDLTTILLHATVELVWASGAQARTLTLRYNAVGERHMQAQLDGIRTQRRVVADGQAVLSPGEARARAAVLPLKFRNYLWLSLLRGDALVDFVYEPALVERSRLHRKRLPGRLVAVTARELLVVEEPRHVEYGMTRRSYPLSALAQVREEPQAELSGLRLTFSAGLASHEVMLPLSNDNRLRLRQAVASLPARDVGPTVNLV